MTSDEAFLINHWQERQLYVLDQIFDVLLEIRNLLTPVNTKPEDARVVDP